MKKERSIPFPRKIFINDLHTHSNTFRRIGSIRRMDVETRVADFLEEEGQLIHVG